MLSYILIAPILYLLSYLPSRVLYKLSDVLAYVLCHIIKYRKKLVLENIQRSFPEKSEAEQKEICRKSYNHLADRIVETLKCISISEEEVNERATVKNIELIDKWMAEKKSIVALLGHIGAWEYGAYKASIILECKTFGVVSMLSNPYFNRMVQRTRGRMGMKLIAMQHASAFFSESLKEHATVFFIGDQSPNPKRAYWTQFLNQDTGFFTGGERYAKAHNCAVVYIEMAQVERGKYTIELFEICDDANAVNENEITEQFSKHLEQTIRKNPSDWLWSHNRWKHKRPI